MKTHQIELRIYMGNLHICETINGVGGFRHVQLGGDPGADPRHPGEITFLLLEELMEVGRDRTSGITY